MTSPATSESSQLSPDSQIWHNLKHAIAASSGFQRWQMDYSVTDKLPDDSLECLVRRYLRETLETLAY
ncbi:MAG TPA: hypothetical protein DD379_08850 [Cyanobacteria bacterium UBA11162]|nr:hypothetical protein [Cyanobacteria bacterium UBA11370]HBL11499.1 hypothetical protein [Cyanobacteria bacterium UBA11162]HBY81468.1 hypothetical protein [Cyanobacteria bacterium UBA11148]